MTDRERWTVYPLLFMTLGIALTGKLTNQVQTKEVVCDKLVCKAMVVIDSKGHEQVTVFSDASGGQLRAKQLISEKQVCNDLQCRTAVITDERGHEQVAVFANDAGGQIRLQGNLTKIRTLLGNTDRVSGLLMFDDQGHPMQGSSVAIPARPPADSQPAAPAEEPGEEPSVSTPEQSPEKPAEKPPE